MTLFTIISKQPCWTNPAHAGALAASENAPRWRIGQRQGQSCQMKAIAHQHQSSHLLPRHPWHIVTAAKRAKLLMHGYHVILIGMNVETISIKAQCPMPCGKILPDSCIWERSRFSISLKDFINCFLRALVPFVGGLVGRGLPTGSWNILYTPI